MVTERDVLVAHARHLELLRWAEQERLARQICGGNPRPASPREFLYRVGCLLVTVGHNLQKIGGRPEPARLPETTPAFRR